MKLTILLVDDNDFYRQGFKLMLERFDFIANVYELKSGIAFLEQVSQINPDLVFMDIKMPDMDGIEATKRATNENRALKIIALTMFGDDNYLNKMIEVGAKGYLLKDSDVDEIEKGIKLVVSDGFYFSRRVFAIKNQTKN